MDNPYLSTDNGGMTTQLTRLLRDEETDNCLLLLELIGGGGINRRLMGYLFGIAVAHKQAEVQARAMALLQKYASPETLTQAQRLKSALPYYYNESEYLGKYRNPEFDLFDFLLAYKMCNWHGIGSARSERYRITHQTLNLSSYPEDRLSEAIGTLDFVRHIVLPAHKDFDLEQAYPLLLTLPLESVFIENTKLNHFPGKLFELPNLKSLSIKRGTYRPRNPMSVAIEAATGSPSLEKLFIEGYAMEHTEHLGDFPKLREASLVRCGLDNINFLKNSRNLEVLNIKFNLLSTLPAFLGTFTAMRILELGGNPFQKIEIDISNMSRLEELDLRLKYDRAVRFY